MAYKKASPDDASGLLNESAKCLCLD